ncbi:hypothetical protein RKD45_005423 [Streptomyces griseus]
MRLEADETADADFLPGTTSSRAVRFSRCWRAQLSCAPKNRWLSPFASNRRSGVSPGCRGNAKDRPSGGKGQDTGNGRCGHPATDSPQLAPVRMQRKVGEGHHDVPVLRTSALGDPLHQRGQVLGLRGEGLTDHPHIEPPRSGRLPGEPTRECPGQTTRDLRWSIRIRQQSYDRNALRRPPHDWTLRIGCPAITGVHTVPAGTRPASGCMDTGTRVGRLRKPPAGSGGFRAEQRGLALFSLGQRAVLCSLPSAMSAAGSCATASVWRCGIHLGRVDREAARGG